MKVFGPNNFAKSPALVVLIGPIPTGKDAHGKRWKVLANPFDWHIPFGAGMHTATSQLRPGPQLRRRLTKWRIWTFDRAY